MTRRSGALVALVLLLASLAAGAAPARAHEVDPSVRTVIDEVDPEVPGLTIEVGTSVTTQLLLANRTDRVVEVLDDDGQPFVRIGPEGVDGNLAAPAWYQSNQPFGAADVPPGADVAAAARWARVSDEPTWGWFDHRLHPSAVVGALGEARLPTFEVALRYDGRRVEVRGHLERRTTIPRFTAALRAVPDPASGFAVQLLDGRAPGLFARYQGAGEVVVLGGEGEPFLRLGPTGAEVNRRSPTWRFTAQASGAELAGIDTSAAAEPDWQVVADGPSYAWLDPRALIGEVGDAPVTLEWTVPVTIDGRPDSVAGTSTARLAPIEEVAGGAPSSGGPGHGLVLVVGLAAVTLGAGWWLLRGRG